MTTDVPPTTDGAAFAGKSLRRRDRRHRDRRHTFGLLLGVALAAWGFPLRTVVAQSADKPTAGPAAEPRLVVDGPAAEPQHDWQADARLLSGLRARGLFAVAESYCRDKLARADVSSRTRAELVLELSRTLAARAVYAPPDAREPLWSAASQTIDEFLRTNADHPRAIVLRLQDALVTQGRGELALRESELLPGDATLPATAQKYLREAIGRLAVLQDDVTAALRRVSQASAPSSGDPLTAVELTAFDRNVRYQIAKAQQDIAETYPAGSNDRIDALAQADRLLDPLAATTSEDEVIWQARVDRVRVERKLGRAAQAQKRIDQLLSKARPAWVDARLAIERALLAADAGNFDAAFGLLDAMKLAAGGIDAAEVDDLRLQVVLQAWRTAHQAGDDKTTAARQAEAATLVRRIGEQHGPYWSRRAKLRAAATISSGAGASDATLLASAAENFLHTGRPDDAIASYDKAAAAAKAGGDDDLAFRLALTAAAVEQQQKRLKEALTRYAALARSSPHHADAAKAHLQATWDAAHAFGPRSTEYRQLIDEHLKLWPASPTADEARFWLARALQGERKWREAADAYRRVRPAAASFDQAVAGAVFCVERAIASTADDRNGDQARSALAAEYAAWFESLVAAADGAWPETLSPSQRTAVLAAAGLRLRHVAMGAPDATKLLAKARVHAADAPADWLGRLALLEVESAAARGDFDRADAALAALTQTSGEPAANAKIESADLSDTVSSLTALRDRSADEPSKRRIAALELAVGKLLAARAPASSAKEPAASASARRASLEALAAAGRREEAVAAYRKLAAEFPNDAAVQRGYAVLLGQGNDRQALAAALDQWRLVEQRTKSGTAEWFAAKYEVAALHERLGDKPQALRVVTLLAALYPDLGGDAMKAKFDALRKRCQP